MKDMIKYFSFTRNEAKVIIFIVGVLVAGFSIKYYKQVINSSSKAPFDFSKSDDEFKKLSAITHTEISDSFSKTSNEKIGIDETNRNSDRNDQNEKINLNIATIGELETLPGIGNSTAEKIIAFRDKQKSFRNIEELMKVSGIGKKKFEKIKNLVTVK